MEITQQATYDDDDDDDDDDDGGNHIICDKMASLDGFGPHRALAP